ncbi:MAG: hypothetical protein RIQ60_632 [Pseudomonadota bacterium]|jgi:hypothetical protein
MTAPFMPPRSGATPGPAALEDLLTSVENDLAALGDALRRRDSTAIEERADLLLRSLSRAADAFNRAARGPGGVPVPLRERLTRASQQVAAQRESLLRTTVALNRTVEALLPQQQRPVYGPAQGLSKAYRR